MEFESVEAEKQKFEMLCSIHTDEARWKENKLH